MRLNFPEDESKFGWLPLLLDAYAIIEEGLALSIKEEEGLRGARLVCSEGCSSCCRAHKDIPVYPLELVGIWWYSTEKLFGPLRESLKNNLSSHESGGQCPFCIDNSCSIHPFRPVACRLLNVFGKPCAEGEDPYYTRRQDVLAPDRDFIDHAVFTMLPFYGILDEEDKMRAVEDGLIHSQARILQGSSRQDCNWKDLAKKMDEFESPA